MLQVFSISFILAGLPIIFSLQSMFHLDKLFIYSSMAIVLLSGMNYKNILLYKFNNLDLKNFIILLVVFEFFIIALLSKSNLKQLRDLVIIIWIVFCILTFNKYKVKHDVLLKLVFYISLFSVIMTYISTPISLSYWSLHGGRLYIGDTKNPSLVAWTVSLNIISIFFYLYKYKVAFFVKICLSIILIIDLYLFFLAQSKSSVIGFIFIILFYILKYKSKLVFNKKFLMFFLYMFIISMIYWDYISYYSSLIYGSFTSLFYGNNIVLSASIRKANFDKAFELLSISNIFGHGINIFRMDSPILQVFIDFGNIMGIIIFILLVVYPLFKLYVFKYELLTINEEFSILIYLFFLPNLFFHGTPYEWSIWLPVLIFFMFEKKEKICIALK